MVDKLIYIPPQCQQLSSTNMADLYIWYMLFLLAEGPCYFYKGIHFGIKEVRSKISILLETTGGIVFLLEVFEKMLFTI